MHHIFFKNEIVLQTRQMRNRDRRRFDELFIAVYIYIYFSFKNRTLAYDSSSYGGNQK